MRVDSKVNLAFRSYGYRQVFLGGSKEAGVHFRSGTEPTNWPTKRHTPFSEPANPSSLLPKVTVPQEPLKLGMVKSMTQAR